MVWVWGGRDGLGVGREGWSGCGEGGMVWVWGGRDGLGVGREGWSGCGASI